MSSGRRRLLGSRLACLRRPEPPWRQNRLVADDLAISLPVGARVLVVADLRLGVAATDESSWGACEVARAIAAWSGPGAVVVAGDLFDIEGNEEVGIPQALAAHGSLRDALGTFAAAAGRRVVVLPGRRDPWLLTSPATARALFACTGAEVASAVVVELSTVAGTRAVRIEPGHRLHPAPAGRHGPVEPGHPRLADVVPGVWRGRTSGWLAGMSDLDDPDAASRFVASRLVYRQFGRRAWLLAVPVVVALLARLPVAFLRPARHVAGPLLTTALVAAAARTGRARCLGRRLSSPSVVGVLGQGRGPGISTRQPERRPANWLPRGS